MSVDRAKSFYDEHKDRPFFDDLVNFVTSNTVVAMVLGKENAVNDWRALLGPTNSKQAKEEVPDSIRARFGTDVQKNAAHGSDSISSAEREIKIFFPDFDLAQSSVQTTGEKARQFLMMSVVPILTAGLTEMCKLSTRPADPLDWLSNYLRDNNPARANKPKIFFVLGGPGAGRNHTKDKKNPPISPFTSLTHALCPYPSWRLGAWLRTRRLSYRPYLSVLNRQGYSV